MAAICRASFAGARGSTKNPKKSPTPGGGGDLQSFTRGGTAASKPSISTATQQQHRITHCFPLLLKKQKKRNRGIESKPAISISIQHRITRCFPLADMKTRRDRGIESKPAIYISTQQHRTTHCFPLAKKKKRERGIESKPTTSPSRHNTALIAFRLLNTKRGGSGRLTEQP